MSVSTVALNQAFTAYCAKCKQKEVTLRWNKWPNNCSNETRSSRPRENVIGCTDVSQEAHKETSHKTCIKLLVCSVGARETAREPTGSSSRIWNLSSPSSPRSITPVAIHVNPRWREDREANDDPQKVRIRSVNFTSATRSLLRVTRAYVRIKSPRCFLCFPWPRVARSSFASVSFITGTTHTTSAMEKTFAPRLWISASSFSAPAISCPQNIIGDIEKLRNEQRGESHRLFFQQHLDIESLDCVSSNIPISDNNVRWRIARNVISFGVCLKLFEITVSQSFTTSC